MTKNEAPAATAHPFVEIIAVEADGEREFVGTERTREAAEEWIEGQMEDLFADAEDAGRLPTTHYVIVAPDLTGCAKGLAGRYCGSTEHAMHGE